MFRTFPVDGYRARERAGMWCAHDAGQWQLPNHLSPVTRLETVGACHER
jgi:hypothetical protein